MCIIMLLICHERLWRRTGLTPLLRRWIFPHFLINTNWWHTRTLQVYKYQNSVTYQQQTVIRLTYEMDLNNIVLVMQQEVSYTFCHILSWSVDKIVCYLQETETNKLNMSIVPSVSEATVLASVGSICHGHGGSGVRSGDIARRSEWRNFFFFSGGSSLGRHSVHRK